ncbi:MAG: hypothetical protein IJ622_02075 [Bacteroidales bacterium]|nr:hypothetical protein [Bacteroidales bacterium]
MTNNCKSDIYTFGLLLRQIFPHRYRHIAAKCTRENPERRYPDMEAVRKAMQRSDRWRSLIPVLALLVLMVSLVFLVARQTSPTTIVSSETQPNGLTTDQKKYINEGEWQVNLMLRPIAEEAEKGSESREVLLARLVKTSVELKAMCNEMALLYPANSSEWMTFVTEVGKTQQNKERQLIDQINANCKPYQGNDLEGLVSPTVMTLPVTEITGTSAVGGIDVLKKGNAEGKEFGLCWGMLHNPTINGVHARCDRIADPVVMSGLLPNATYFVRAYLTNAAGTTYGNEVAFTTLPAEYHAAVPEGALPGCFSVSEGKQVLFSKGNLQYQATTGTWRFAEHQYDFVGKDNEKVSETYSGWIDLFGWATSGYDHGAVCYQPWCDHKDTQSNAMHYAYGRPDANLYHDSGKADWGYNAISNGGNKENLWRTLTKKEWVYVLFVRNTASGVRFAKASMNGVNGLVVLPDNWMVATYQFNAVNNSDLNYYNNIISLADWQNTLEPAGAVFLPEAGARTIDGVYPDLGNYQSSSVGTGDNYGLVIGDNRLVVLAEGHRGDGRAVRLVREED